MPCPRRRRQCIRLTMSIVFAQECGWVTSRAIDSPSNLDNPIPALNQFAQPVPLHRGCRPASTTEPPATARKPLPGAVCYVLYVLLTCMYCTHTVIMRSSLDTASKRARASCNRNLVYERANFSSVRCPYTLLSLAALAAHKLPVISSKPGRHGKGWSTPWTRTRCRPRAARSKETRLSTPVGTRHDLATQTATSAKLERQRTTELPDQAGKAHGVLARVWCALVASRRARATFR
jgi:hypothetical protein